MIGREGGERGGRGVGWPCASRWRAGRGERFLAITRGRAGESDLLLLPTARSCAGVRALRASLPGPRRGARGRLTRAADGFVGSACAMRLISRTSFYRRSVSTRKPRCERYPAAPLRHALEDLRERIVVDHREIQNLDALFERARPTRTRAADQPRRGDRGTVSARLRRPRAGRSALNHGAVTPSTS